MVKPNEGATEADAQGRSSSHGVGPRPSPEFHRLSYGLHPTTLDLTRSPNPPRQRVHPPAAGQDHRFRVGLDSQHQNFGAFVRLLLHRAESGTRPRTEFHGSVLTGQERTTLVRLALMGAALVLRDGATERLLASVRRRLHRLHGTDEIPRRLRDIANRVLDGKLAAAPAGASGDLEFELGEDAGFDWIAEFSARSGLLPSRPHEELPPLELASGGLARAALETLPTTQKERHELYLQASAISDVVWSRAFLMANCAEAMKALDPADPRSDAAALVIVTMVHLRPGLSSPSKWDCQAPELLQFVASRTQRNEIRRLANELLRFPTSAGRETVTRDLWQEIDAIRTSLAEQEGDARKRDVDEDVTRDVVLDLGSDDIGIEVNGAPARYGGKGRGGQLTIRHQGVRALVAIAMGQPVPHCAANAVTDVNRAFAACGVGVARLSRRRGTLVLDGCSVVLTDRLRASMHPRPARRRSSSSSR